MSGRSVTLEELDAYLAARRKELAFPPAIEAIYDEQMQSYRLRVMRKLLWPTVVVYNAYLLADVVLLPQTLLLAALLHMGLVTPVIFLATFLYSKASKLWQRELVVTSVPLLMVVQIMLIYALNRGGGADQYHYPAIMVLVFMNVNQRFGFRLALASTCLIVAVYLGVLLRGHSSVDVKFVGAGMMISAAYISVHANRRMERDVRHAFLRRLQDQLRRQGAEEVAKRDPLTGLGNRLYLEERVEALWSLRTDCASPIAVIMMDIDHFKAFNDHYGHAAGDDCIRRVASAIAAELRSDSDLGVRFGGEEFLIVLPRTDQSGAVRMAERLRQRIESLAIPHQRSATSDTVTASFGVIAGPPFAHSFAEAAAAADSALYAAKRNGRNQVWPPFSGESSSAPAARQAAEIDEAEVEAMLNAPIRTIMESG